MEPHPYPPLLVMALGIVCAGISYSCHQTRNLLHRNKLYPLPPAQKVVRWTSVMNLWRAGPYGDEYQKHICRRAKFDLDLFVWKWAGAFVAFIAIVVYPVVYLLTLSGRG